jgi:hypothetical protein
VSDWGLRLGSGEVVGEVILFFIIIIFGIHVHVYIHRLDLAVVFCTSRLFLALFYLNLLLLLFRNKKAILRLYRNITSITTSYSIYKIVKILLLALLIIECYL